QVIKVDGTPPTVACPADVTAGTDAGTCSAKLDPGAATADNNPGVTVAGKRGDGKSLTDPYPVGKTTITWTATDAAGNSATCTQNVTVKDAEKPVLTVPVAVSAMNDK